MKPRSVKKQSTRLRKSINAKVGNSFVNGIADEFIERCIEVGAIDWKAFPNDVTRLSPEILKRIRRLQRLCHGLEIDAFVGSIVVDLLERIEVLERNLAYLVVVEGQQASSRFD
jgi:hypothetical protein